MFKSALNVVIGIFVFCFFVFATPAFAQTVQPPENLHIYTQNVMIEVASSLSCLLSGIDPINPSQKCLGVNNGKIGPVDSSGGAIGAMGNLIAMTYSIPVHAADYTRYLAKNFGVSKKAYADNGIGFQGLSPLIPIWSAFRNITYLLFVIVFVAIGLAIMLRVHIDPRTVMTIENQIPKIIVGLILVTFSFAIGGFLIDLMYVGISLSVNVLQTTDSKNLTLDNANRIAYSTNPLDAANQLGGINGNKGGLAALAGGPSEAIGSFIKPIFDNDPGRLVTAIAGGIIGNILGGNAGKIAEGVGGALGGIIGFIAGAPTGPGAVATAAAGAVAGSRIARIVGELLGLGIGYAKGGDIVALLGSIIAFLVILIAILFALFRVWIALLQAYIFILLDIVFAPFWILAGLIPGSSISFTAWLRDLGSNILAFPATIIVLLLGRIMADKFSELGPSQQVFLPPLIGSPGVNAIGSLIGLGIILILPNIVSMMKALFKAPKFDIASIGAAVGVGTGALGAGVGSIFSFYRKPPTQIMGQRMGWHGVGERLFGRF